MLQVCFTTYSNYSDCMLDSEVCSSNTMPEHTLSRLPDVSAGCKASASEQEIVQCITLCKTANYSFYMYLFRLNMLINEL